MPIYEFRCTSCGEVVEKMQKYDDDPPPCRACEEETQRIMSRGSFALKGTGWYATEFPKKDGRS